MDEQIDALYDGLANAKSGLDNAKLMWNQIWQTEDGPARRRVIGEFLNQIERCERGIRTAQSMTEVVVK